MSNAQDQRRVLKAYRAGLEPTPARLDAVWAAISDRDPAPQRRRTQYIGAAAAVLAAAAAVAVWWVGLTSTPATVVPLESGSQAPYREESSTPDLRGTSRVPPKGHPSAPSPPAPVLVPVEVQRPHKSSVTSPPRRPTPERAGSAVDSLAEEAELLRQAEHQLREGAFGAALQVLDTCGRKYPSGELVVERLALRVIALCRAGNRVQGRGEAARVHRDPASRPYTERIRRACEAE